MQLITSYYFRLKRKRRLIRAYRKAISLQSVSRKTGQIGRDDLILCATMRNELARLPFFLDYYRKLGIGHFLIVDNGSADQSVEYLSAQPDVSVWRTEASYKRANFGVDWVNFLLTRYARGHWALTVDSDEFLQYPYSDTRPLRALTDWLDASGYKCFPAMLLDMYPKNEFDDAHLAVGENPLKKLRYFDAGNYVQRLDPLYRNLWIQGGPRRRTMFAHDPEQAPALNKIPLVKWRLGYAYISSTHSLLPRGLNQVYEEWGGEKPSGALLHAKFCADIGTKAADAVEGNRHYAGSREYLALRGTQNPVSHFWQPQSAEYEGWQQLEELGLISAGGWA